MNMQSQINSNTITKFAQLEDKIAGVERKIAGIEHKIHGIELALTALLEAYKREKVASLGEPSRIPVTQHRNPGSPRTAFPRD